MNTTLLILAEGEEHIDRTHSWIWPEGYEIYFGGLASIVVFSLLFWKVGPLVKKAMGERTGRIQAELDGAIEAKASAATEAAEIRQAKGDIETERQRLLAEADVQAEALLADGRLRLDREIVELEAKAEADIAAALQRSGDELRAEIAAFSGAAAERAVARSLDDSTQQDLIEAFIAGVGASA